MQRRRHDRDEREDATIKVDAHLQAIQTMDLIWSLYRCSNRRRCYQKESNHDTGSATTQAQKAGQDINSGKNASYKAIIG